MGTSAIQTEDAFMDGMVDRQRIGRTQLTSRPVCKWMNCIPITAKCLIHMGTIQDFYCFYSPISAYLIY
jgi:hypothetical protein